MAKQTRKLSERPGWTGYAVAIVVSALGHIGFLVFAFLILPNWLHSDAAPPPAMTVKIVDNIPAGDLGTHLPKLHKPPEPEQVAKEEVKPDEPPPPEEKPPEPPKPDNDDKNAISLSSPVPTPTPAPPPPPAVIPATEVPTSTPTPKKVAEPAPTPAPPPVVHHHDKVIVHNPAPKPKHTPVMMAKAEPTPDVHEQFRKLQQEMLKKRIEEARKQAAQDKEDSEDDSDDDNSDTESTPPASENGGHGPVASNANTAGSGYGVGSGTGSMGEIKDLQYLLYFRTVQQRVKDAWTFPGGSNDLSADVEFSIGADGTLNGVKIAKSSGDSAFDDSVMRAIKRAAPFPPPPDRYRSQFSDVVSTFKLGELKS